MILIWSLIHATVMTIAVMFIITGVTSALLPALTIISTTALLILNKPQLVSQFLWLGRANWISIIRLCSVLIIFLCYEKLTLLLTSPGISLLLLLILCLDGLDGFLARYYGETSQLGAYLDMETDAVIILHLCLILCIHHQYSLTLLFFALLRYLYVITLQCIVRNPRLEPKRRYASTIAVIFNLAILINLADQSYPSKLLLMLASLLLLYSFSRSFLYQLKPFD